MNMMQVDKATASIATVSAVNRFVENVKVIFISI